MRKIMKKKLALFSLSFLLLCAAGCNKKEDSVSLNSETTATVSESVEAVETAASAEATQETSSIEETVEDSLPILQEGDWQFILCDQYGNIPVCGFNFTEIPGELEFLRIATNGKDGSVNYPFFEKEITLPDTLEISYFETFFKDYNDPLYTADPANTYTLRIHVLRNVRFEAQADEISTYEKKAILETYWGPVEIYYDTKGCEYAFLTIDTSSETYVIRIICNPTRIPPETRYWGYLEKQLPVMFAPASESDAPAPESGIPASESDGETS